MPDGTDRRLRKPGGPSDRLGVPPFNPQSEIRNPQSPHFTSHGPFASQFFITSNAGFPLGM